MVIKETALPAKPKRSAKRITAKMGPRRKSSLAQRIAALPPGKRAAVEEFVESLSRGDRDLTRAAARTSEAVFGRIWDNPDDAEYDRL